MAPPAREQAHHVVGLQRLQRLAYRCSAYSKLRSDALDGDLLTGPQPALEDRSANPVLGSIGQ